MKCQILPHFSLPACVFNTRSQLPHSPRSALMSEVRLQNDQSALITEPRRPRRPRPQVGWTDTRSVLSRLRLCLWMSNRNVVGVGKQSCRLRSPRCWTSFSRTLLPYRKRNMICLFSQDAKGEYVSQFLDEQKRTHTKRGNSETLT